MHRRGRCKEQLYMQAADANMTVVFSLSSSRTALPSTDKLTDWAETCHLTIQCINDVPWRICSYISKCFIVLKFILSCSSILIFERSINRNCISKVFKNEIYFVSRNSRKQFFIDALDGSPNIGAYGADSFMRFISLRNFSTNFNFQSWGGPDTRKLCGGYFFHIRFLQE